MRVNKNGLEWGLKAVRRDVASIAPGLGKPLLDPILDHPAFQFKSPALALWTLERRACRQPMHRGPS
jgi:hypothetical protein